MLRDSRQLRRLFRLLRRLAEPSTFDDVDEFFCELDAETGRPCGLLDDEENRAVAAFHALVRRERHLGTDRNSRAWRALAGGARELRAFLARRYRVGVEGEVVFGGDGVVGVRVDAAAGGSFVLVLRTAHGTWDVWLESRDDVVEAVADYDVVWHRFDGKP